MNTPAKSEYLMLFRGDQWYERLPLEELQLVIDQNKAWIERLIEQGKVKGGQALFHEGALVGQRSGRVTDGPFVESKEAVGGTLLIEADSMEEAVAVARTHPSLRYGTMVEVRQVAPGCPLDARARRLAEEERVAAGT